MAKNKPHSSPAPTVTKVKQDLFIKRLAAGDAPGTAAKAIDIDRSTAYNWKKADAEFSAKWDNAVETSLDDLESELYEIAKDDPDNISPRIKAIETTLRNRRYGSGGGIGTSHQQTNFILNVTMEEHFKRLTRLGVPLPDIEWDYDEPDAQKRK